MELIWIDVEVLKRSDVVRRGVGRSQVEHPPGSSTSSTMVRQFDPAPKVFAPVLGDAPRPVTVILALMVSVLVHVTD